MDDRTLLAFMAQDQGLTTAALAKALDISAPYTSLLLSGRRSIPAKVSWVLQAYAGGSSAFKAFRLTAEQIEQHVRRPLTGAEQVAFARVWPELRGVLTALQNTIEATQETQIVRGMGAPPRFEIATALASVQSLSQILDEEPDLSLEQRQLFTVNLRAQAQTLTRLLTPEGGENASEPSGHSLHPNRYVDQVFAAHAYCFDTLEQEADLLVRRARRHGPLGTYALAERLTSDLGIDVEWVEQAGMAPSSFSNRPPEIQNQRLALDPSLGQAQLRFRLAQYLIAQECERQLEELIAAEAPPNTACHYQLKKALIAYTAGAMFMPYTALLEAAETHRYDIDWLSRHFACSFEQVCHRLLALRRPDAGGVPFGMLRVSPAGQTISRIPIPGLALPDRFPACPLWAAYGALQHPRETVTQLAEFPDGERFLFIGRLCEGPRAHFGGPRRLTSLMLACDWAYVDRLIYADGHDPQRRASLTPVGHACVTCPRADCRSRTQPYQGD